MTVLRCLIQEMAEVLAASGCNLGDEKAVMRILAGAGFRHGDVLVFSDLAAVDAVQRRSEQSSGRAA